MPIPPPPRTWRAPHPAGGRLPRRAARPDCLQALAEPRASPHPPHHPQGETPVPRAAGSGGTGRERSPAAVTASRRRFPVRRQAGEPPARAPDAPARGALNGCGAGGARPRLRRLSGGGAGRSGSGGGARGGRGWGGGGGGGGGSAGPGRVRPLSRGGRGRSGAGGRSRKRRGRR